MRRAGALGLLLLLAVGCADAPASSPAPADTAALRDALREACRWFERSQEKDGSFSLHRWNPHHGRSGLPGWSEEDHWLDVAATGLVVLAFVEADHGSIHQAGDGCYRRALRWLLRNQVDEGRFGYYEGVVDDYFVSRIHKRSIFHGDGPTYQAQALHMFNHAIPTAALATAYRATRDATLREPLRKALRHLAHDEHDEFVWTSYYDPYGDMAVVSYVMLAARAAADAGLEREARPLLEPALDFLDRVTDEATGRAAMTAEHPHCFDGYDSTAINAYCRRLLGEASSAPTLSRVLGVLTQAELDWRAAPDPAEGYDVGRPLGGIVNHELWYHGTCAFDDGPAEAATAFRERVVGLLVAHQERETRRRGSWAPIGIWDRMGGRLYATAMATRTLGAELARREGRPGPGRGASSTAATTVAVR